MSRLLTEYEQKMDQLVKLKSAVADHEEQFLICSKLDVQSLKIASIQQRTKNALLLKISDKIESLKSQMLEIISGVKSNVDLLFAKFDKIQSNDSQFVSWALEVCHTFNQHYIKCELLKEHATVNDATNDEEEEDISDQIFKHRSRTTKPGKRLQFHFSHEEKQHLLFYCEVVNAQLSKETISPQKTPKR